MTAQTLCALDRVQDELHLLELICDEHVGGPASPRRGGGRIERRRGMTKRHRAMSVARRPAVLTIQPADWLKTSRRTSVALLRAGAVFEKGKLSNAYKTPPDSCRG